MKSSASPAYLSQHVGGFIIADGRLDELVPIENARMDDRTVICWVKDDIDSLGILKVDVLSLGMLIYIRKAFDSINPTDNPHSGHPKTRRSTICCVAPTVSGGGKWNPAPR